MANIASNSKSAKKDLERRARNIAIKSKIKNIIKKVLKPKPEHSLLEERQKNLRIAQKLIFKSTSKGVLHKNTARRKFSRLVKNFNKIIQTS